MSVDKVVLRDYEDTYEPPLRAIEVKRAGPLVFVDIIRVDENFEGGSHERSLAAAFAVDAADLVNAVELLGASELRDQQRHRQDLNQEVADAQRKAGEAARQDYYDRLEHRRTSSARKTERLFEPQVRLKSLEERYENLRNQLNNSSAQAAREIRALTEELELTRRTNARLAKELDEANLRQGKRKPAGRRTT